MSIAKDQIKQVFEGQPDDSNYDELLRELAFKRMVNSGISDAKNGRTISNEDMERKIREWRK
ncbi:hypothetical protein MNBD_GAMMA12-863 [hydrothermal vent metagenome]|uniref:Uncharacterized protein n=1 Tax=hydrothermal vent metagenome TaxID=652676 RepID=A0A3B0YTL3_9ZZZZ